MTREGELKKQIAGETRARELAEAKVAVESARADLAERAARELTRDRDQWRERAHRAEAMAASLGAPE